MQAYSKQLGRMLVQEIGKEEKSAKARGGQWKKTFVTLGKHYPPYPAWFQKLPIPLLPTPK